MSRNRMKNSQSLHWMGVIKWILITGLMAGLGLCYIICKNQNLRLAQETQDVRKKLEAIEARNAELAADLESMKSPKALERRLLVIHSTLVPWNDPNGAIWVWLDENTRGALVRMGNMNFDSTPVAATAQPRQQQ